MGASSQPTKHGQVSLHELKPEVTDQPTDQSRNAPTTKVTELWCPMNGKDFLQSYPVLPPEKDLMPLAGDAVVRS
jgi:hypothetical protein